MIHVKHKDVCPADMQQFGQVCCCFVLLPWPSCWSWVITLATFLTDYFNLRTVKYFSSLSWPFPLHFAWEEPASYKSQALGSYFDQEGLAQSASPNLFKAEYSFLHFWDWNVTLIPNRSYSSFLSCSAHLDSSLSQMFVLHSPQCNLPNKRSWDLDLSQSFSLTPVLYI